MCKYVFCFFMLLGQAGVSLAQSVQDTLFVVPGKENLYFYHVVTKGESLYGVARNYHLDPKALANANKISLNTPLKLYQLLKIPLDSNNLVQSAESSTSGLTPLYHKVIKGETLYHIGQMHDKVDPALLKQWNHLGGNDLKTGQYLVVGWLKAANAVANPALASANNSSAVESPVKDKAVVTNPPVSAGETAAEPERKNTAVSSAAPQHTGGGANTSSAGNFLNEVIASENRNRTPSVSRSGAAASPAESSARSAAVVPASSNNGENAFAANDKPEPARKITETTVPKQKEEIQNKNKAVVKEKPVPKKKEKGDTAAKEDNPFAKMLNEVTHKPKAATTVTKPANPATEPVKADPAIPHQPAEAENRTAAASPVTAVAGPEEHSIDSAALTTSVKSEFEQQFMQQTNNEAQIEAKKGAAGWFRSNVKPGSGRYYALCDELPRGTIIKVINPISGKYVLAKVLDAIPKQKENYNLIVKLSDAAMEDLGVSQSRFWCEIQFAKNGKK